MGPERVARKKLPVSYLRGSNSYADSGRCRLTYGKLGETWQRSYPPKDRLQSAIFDLGTRITRAESIAARGPVIPPEKTGIRGLGLLPAPDARSGGKSQEQDEVSSNQADLILLYSHSLEPDSRLKPDRLEAIRLKERAARAQPAFGSGMERSEGKGARVMAALSLSARAAGVSGNTSIWP